MIRRPTPVVRVVMLALACSIATAATGATIQREFRYSSDEIQVRAGGVIEINCVP